MSTRPAIVCCRLLLLISPLFSLTRARGADESLSDRAQTTMRRAATYYRERVAMNGGYVYYYSLDLSRRLGEGVARADQIWVQPPGTPTVGLAYLAAYEASGDEYYLDAATEAADALIYGQLQSGGWQNSIEFTPQGSRNRYRNGQGGGRRNNSSLDDGITQAALKFLIRADQALEFQHEPIHETAEYALEALLQAQFPTGGFPQVWTGPVDQNVPVLKADFPPYDWRNEGRIKEYWDLYTLNDGLAGTVFQTLKTAHEVYGDDASQAAIERLGEFLILAQMPQPQPGWAQQYNYDMHPVWARKFEPPAISGAESQDVMDTLIAISRLTGDPKYLEPIPRALEYFRTSLLPDGQLARYYELRTNRPLYMQRRGDVYSLTYSDADLPSHYGWKWSSRLDEIERAYDAARQNRDPQPPDAAALEAAVRIIIDDLDDEGRWFTTYQGEPLTGQPTFRPGDKYVSSAVFSRNMQTLSQYVGAANQ